jgi:hypothetical protein
MYAVTTPAYFVKAVVKVAKMFVKFATWPQLMENFHEKLDFRTPQARSKFNKKFTSVNGSLALSVYQL